MVPRASGEKSAACRTTVVRFAADGKGRGAIRYDGAADHSFGSFRTVCWS